MHIKMHEGASSGSEPRKATSLQESVPAKIIFFSGNVAITLEEVTPTWTKPTWRNLCLSFL